MNKNLPPITPPPPPGENSAPREEYKDVLPISDETKQKCLIYIEALENEKYEVCSKFIIL